jgi:hypothetical protein
MKQHIEERKGTFSSGGRRIEDHSNWIGASPKHAPLPEVGGKMMQEHSAEGAGRVMEYEDTTGEIKKYQEMGDKKIKGHGRKPGHRN